MPHWRPFQSCLALWVSLVCIATPAQAWGPHPAITQAALDSLGTNDALVRTLGEQAQQLTNYCWMAWKLNAT